MTDIIKRKSESPARTLWEDFFGEDFNDLFRIVPRAFSLVPEFTRTHEWVPRVDVRETSDAIIFSAEVPGMNEKDIEITVEDNILTIKGERKFERDEKKENYHRIERHYGTFQRSFTLTNNLDTDKVEATYKDGILEITFPKKEETKPKKIQIGVSKDKS